MVRMFIAAAVLGGSLALTAPALADHAVPVRAVGHKHFNSGPYGHYGRRGPAPYYGARGGGNYWGYPGRGGYCGPGYPRGYGYGHGHVHRSYRYPYYGGSGLSIYGRNFSFGIGF